MPKQVNNAAGAVVSSQAGKGKNTKPRKKKGKVFGIETTVHVRRYVRNQRNHRRTPRAIKVIRRRARTLFHVSKVKLDTELNKYMWSVGIKRPPSRVRIKYELKKIRTAEGSKTIVYVSHVPVTSFKHLKTRKLRR